MKYSTITLSAIIVIGLSCFLTACKNDPKESSSEGVEGGAATTQAGKPFKKAPEDGLKVELSKEPLPAQNFDFGSFPSKWTALTKKGADYVVLTPCDKDNREFLLNKDVGHYQIYENMGDDGVDYDLLEFKQMGEKAYQMRVRVREFKKEQTFNCEYDPATGLATWKWKYAFGTGKSNELVFVDTKHLKNYKTENEVCK
ncbi:MAG: hypothetical protein RI894_830 [Bacteroidota bacterium]|jgi:hypothetical protein